MQGDKFLRWSVDWDQFELNDDVAITGAIRAESINAKNSFSIDGERGIDTTIYLKGRDNTDCTMTIRSGLITQTNCPN